MGIEGLCCVASQHIAAAAATTPAQSSNPSSSIPAKHPRPEVLISHDFRWTNGQTLRTGFLDGDDWQKGQVRQYAVEWCRYANLTFAFDPPLNSPCEILISFMEPGSWSQLGTYSLLKTALPIPEASMNFGWMWYGVPEEDLRATILHEFGHALGLVHEHQYWWNQLYWDVPEVYREYRGPPNNWSDEQIRANILMRFSGSGLMRKSYFDGDSIMLYTFPRKLFIGYDEVKKNLEISLLDKGAMFMRYPGRDMGHLRAQIHMAPDGSVVKTWTRPTFSGYTAEECKGLKDWENEEGVANDRWMNK